MVKETFIQKLNKSLSKCPLEQHIAIAVENPEQFATDPDLNIAKQKLRDRGYLGDIMIDYHTDKIYIF